MEPVEPFGDVKYQPSPLTPLSESANPAQKPKGIAFYRKGGEKLLKKGAKKASTSSSKLECSACSFCVDLVGMQQVGGL